MPGSLPGWAAVLVLAGGGVFWTWAAGLLVVGVARLAAAVFRRPGPGWEPETTAEMPLPDQITQEIHLPEGTHVC